MAGGTIYQDDEPGVISEINVTPLVDVVLVLLIIFMVTAGVIADRGISLEKPKTVAGGAVKTTLSVAIDRQRVVHVNGVPYDDLDRAKQAVAVEHRKNPEIKAIISADIEVPHGEVMAVIDLVTLAGVTKFALASLPKRDTPTPVAPN